MWPQKEERIQRLEEGMIQTENKQTSSKEGVNKEMNGQKFGRTLLAFDSVTIKDSKLPSAVCLLTPKIQ